MSRRFKRLVELSGLPPIRLHYTRHLPAVERYHCGYGLNPQYLDVLSAHGMRFTGHDGPDVRIAELPGHPFFLSTLFQPELAIDDGRCHPIVRAFAYAAVAHAAGGATVPVTTGRG
jgi:CTP synthase (UTP-ammonia lyase)